MFEIAGGIVLGFIGILLLITIVPPLLSAAPAFVLIAFLYAGIPLLDVFLMKEFLPQQYSPIGILVTMVPYFIWLHFYIKKNSGSDS